MRACKQRMKARERRARHGLYRRAGAVEKETGVAQFTWGITAGLEGALDGLHHSVLQTGSEGAMNAGSGSPARGRRRGVAPTGGNQAAARERGERVRGPARLTSGPRHAVRGRGSGRGGRGPQSRPQPWAASWACARAWERGRGSAGAGRHRPRPNSRRRMAWAGFGDGLEREGGGKEKRKTFFIFCFCKLASNSN